MGFFLRVDPADHGTRPLPSLTRTQAFDPRLVIPALRCPWRRPRIQKLVIRQRGIYTTGVSRVAGIGVTLALVAEAFPNTGDEVKGC